VSASCRVVCGCVFRVPLIDGYLLDPLLQAAAAFRKVTDGPALAGAQQKLSEITKSDRYYQQLNDCLVDYIYGCVCGFGGRGCAGVSPRPPRLCMCVSEGGQVGGGVCSPPRLLWCWQRAWGGRGG
jgi:hypothetical protein